MSVAKRLRRATVYYGLRFLIGIVNVLPRGMVIWLGEGLGRLLYAALPKQRQMIRHNLTIAFGDSLGEHESSAIGRRFFANAGASLIDVVRLPRHYQRDLAQRIEVDGREHWDRACATGRGVIGITGHLGNWELLAAHVRTFGHPIGVIGRELYQKRLDDLLIANRSTMGLENFATTDSPKRLISWLRTGNALGVLIDNDSHRVRSMMVPFFGRLANTPVGQSVLAIKLDCVVLPMACVRITGNRYRLIIQPPIPVERTDDTDYDIWRLTAHCTAALETLIREYKDQWAWIHDRWHTPPERGVLPERAKQERGWESRLDQ